MTDIQAFHLMLQQEQDGLNPYILALIKLTQVGMEKLKTLDGAPSWEPWYQPENEQ